MIHQLETDYLVIGAGAMGMAFSDVIMTESNATIATKIRWLGYTLCSCDSRMTT